MDWLRVQRAMDVERIITIESRRRAYFDHGAKLEDHEWEAIARHDDLVGEED